MVAPLLVALLCAALPRLATGFAPAPPPRALRAGAAPRTPSRLGPLRSLFGRKKPAAASRTPPPPVVDDPDRGVPVFEIPLDYIKVGGLRIALALHSIGQQNAPAKGTWMANQGDDGVIEMWYNPDRSGMYTVNLVELAGGKGRIEVDRHGPAPSLVYVLQESVQLHKLLDELEELAFGNKDEVKDEDRLLRLEAEGGIDAARGTLPARPE